MIESDLEKRWNGTNHCIHLEQLPAGVGAKLLTTWVEWYLIDLDKLRMHVFSLAVFGAYWDIKNNEFLHMKDS